MVQPLEIRALIVQPRLTSGGNPFLKGVDNLKLVVYIKNETFHFWIKYGGVP